MRRFLSRLLWAAFVMVQDGPMFIRVKLTTGEVRQVNLLPHETPEQTKRAIEREEGRFADGWVDLSDGTRVRASTIDRFLPTATSTNGGAQ